VLYAIWFTHWMAGTTAASSGAGITVAALTVNSITATAVLNIDPAAARPEQHRFGELNLGLGRRHCGPAQSTVPNPNQQYCSAGPRSPNTRFVERGVGLPKFSGSERRASVRFPLALEVHSVSRRRGSAGKRLGNMIDISSSGLRFATPGPLEPGRKLAVAIEWPVLLDGRVQLQLVLAGTVVWSTGTETAMRIRGHEFRTRSAALKAR
jgi:hypothetical protein